jgi:lipoate-protein ligase B
MNKLVHNPIFGLSRYKDVLKLQEFFVHQFLLSKKDPSRHVPPHVITAQFQPTYTSGRRDAGKLSQQEIEYLTADTPYGKAEYHAALRGGQTTYHGPGQLTVYPIIDLKRHGLTARCYVHLLEEVLIKTCARFDLTAFRTKDTGVWTSPDRKVGAIGVHMRRHITSHGVALNITEAVRPFFDRIVACGLEDKQATSFEREGVEGLLEDVGHVFVGELAKSLEGVEEVDKQAPFSMITMPTEFKDLLPHLVAVSNEPVDEESPGVEKPYMEGLRGLLKDIVHDEVELFGTQSPSPGLLMIQTDKGPVFEGKGIDPGTRSMMTQIIR